MKLEDAIKKRDELKLKEAKTAVRPLDEDEWNELRRITFAIDNHWSKMGPKLLAMVEDDRHRFKTFGMHPGIAMDEMIREANEVEVT